MVPRPGGTGCSGPPLGIRAVPLPARPRNHPSQAPGPPGSFLRRLGAGAGPPAAQHPVDRLGRISLPRCRLFLADGAPVGGSAQLFPRSLACPVGGRGYICRPVRLLGSGGLRLTRHHSHREAHGLHAPERGSPSPVLPGGGPLAFRSLHQLLLLWPHHNGHTLQDERRGDLRQLQPGHRHSACPGRCSRLRPAVQPGAPGRR